MKFTCDIEIFENNWKKSIIMSLLLLLFSPFIIIHEISHFIALVVLSKGKHRFGEYSWFGCTINDKTFDMTFYMSWNRKIKLNIIQRTILNLAPTFACIINTILSIYIIHQITTDTLWQFYIVSYLLIGNFALFPSDSDFIALTRLIKYYDIKKNRKSKTI